jgi:DNA-binding GntR family transcriptional regulator
MAQVSKLPTRSKPQLQSTERINLADRVYSTIKSQIHDFALVAGDRLSEAEFGATLGVSRTPVREAFFRLRSEGFLEVEFKSGWVVKPIDFQKLDELYDLRIVLELASVAKLAVLPNPSLEALKKVWLVPESERLTDHRAVGELDEQFHTNLVQAVGNAEMARVHQDITERIRIVRRLDFTRSDRIAATYQEHGKILRAVLQRKVENAQLLLRSHIDQSKIEVRKITLSALHEARSRSK